MEILPELFLRDAFNEVQRLRRPRGYGILRFLQVSNNLMNLLTNKLIEKYLEHHLLNSSYETKTINQLQSNKQFDLVISNYAFSEVPPQTQLSYIKKILSKSKNGYLTMNSGKENSTIKKHLSLEEIKNYIKDIKILEEEPNTSEGNYIIIWGNTKI